MIILFQSLRRSCLGNEIAHPPVHLILHLGFGNRDAIDFSLVKKQFHEQHVLKYLALDPLRAAGDVSLCSILQVLRLHVGFQDHMSSNDRYNSINDGVLCRGLDLKQRHDQEKNNKAGSFHVDSF